jgi:hypothetical protein
MMATSRRTQTNGPQRHGRDKPDDEEKGLDDIHAAILQAFISRRVLKLADAEQLLDAIADATGTDTPAETCVDKDTDIAAEQDSFEEAVAKINTAIHDFDLEIRKTLSQANGTPLWAIVPNLPSVQR